MLTQSTMYYAQLPFQVIQLGIGIVGMVHSYKHLPTHSILLHAE
jgi:hypothetical protein